MINLNELKKGFHTGTYLGKTLLYIENPPWAKVYNAGALDIGTFQTDLSPNPETTKTTINDDGSITGSYGGGSSGQDGLRECCSYVFNHNLAPYIETPWLTNLQDNTLTEEQVHNFFVKWANWLDLTYPGKYVLFSPANEYNFPVGNDGWSDFKVQPEYYSDKLPMMRQVRDSLGLQDKIILCSHNNIHKHSGDWLEGYLPGIVANDILCCSSYMGYPMQSPPDPIECPTSWNQGYGNSSREALLNFWDSVKTLLYDRVCNYAGHKFPFIFIEFALGIVWSAERQGYPYKIWKEGVQTAYNEAVQRNRSWLNGIVWYCGDYMEEDAADEVITLAKLYRSSGSIVPPPLVALGIAGAVVMIVLAVVTALTYKED